MMDKTPIIALHDQRLIRDAFLTRRAVRRVDRATPAALAIQAPGAGPATALFNILPARAIRALFGRFF